MILAAYHYNLYGMMMTSTLKGMLVNSQGGELYYMAPLTLALHAQLIGNVRIYMGTDRTIYLSDILADKGADNFLSKDDEVEYLKLAGAAKNDPKEKSTALIRTLRKVPLGDVENMAVFVCHGVSERVPKQIPVRG
jgi:hypothetical protein